MKGRMGGWVHWDHPQELLVGNHKGKVPRGQRQGPMGSCQLEALVGEQRTSPQEVPEQAQAHRSTHPEGAG